MTRAPNPVPLSECGLLTPKNARFYCGQLGEEKFDRCVARYVRAVLLGGRRFYRRRDLDRWIEGLGRPPQPTPEELLDRMFSDEPEKKQRARPKPAA
jgi:hypothetical protein